MPKPAAPGGTWSAGGAPTPDELATDPRFGQLREGLALLYQRWLAAQPKEA